MRFYFRPKENGKDKRITLGNYPLISFKLASEECTHLPLVYQQGGAVVDAAKTRYKSGGKFTVGQRGTEYLAKHKLTAAGQQSPSTSIRWKRVNCLQAQLLFV